MGKPAIQSTAIIASIVAALAAIAPLFGWAVSETDQAAIRTVLESGLLIVSNVVVVISAAAAIWGRWRAKAQISGIVHPKPILPSPPGTTADDLNRAEQRRHTGEFQP